MFKWARTSSEVKETEKLTEEFLRDVEAAKRQTNKAKHMAKHRRCLRAIKLGGECKLHGGPVSGDNLDLLDVLDEGQVTKEVLSLKATIAIELKIKKAIDGCFHKTVQDGAATSQTTATVDKKFVKS